MIYEEIREIIKKSALRKIQDCGSFDFSVEVPKDQNHGDFSTNIAFVLAKKLKENPLVIANKIINEISDDRISKIEVLPPGFINLFLSEQYLNQELEIVIKKGDGYGSEDLGKGKTVVIDYSAPNIAKSFGVGHLRSTIIGQTIYNIYNFLGWNCIGDNHLGDWGTQFGKLIYQIKKHKLNGVSSSDYEKILKNLTIEELENLYVSFHKDVKANPEIEDKARKEFAKLESGNEENKRIWEICVERSINEFSKIYEILGISIDNSLGESFYAEMTDKIIEELKSKKIVKKSQGALIIEYKDKNIPSLIAVKSDGSSTYLIRDLATIKYRIDKWNPELIVYEVGMDQTLYFKQLFKTVEMLGWPKISLIHIAHGLVRWKHGKFSTRRGDTIHLEEILKEAIDRSFEFVKENQFLSNKEKESIAKIVGVGAVKYNDLSQHFSRDIVFDWDKILNLKGNSGPYIQYTFARCKGVLKKTEEFNYKGPFKFNQEEMAIIRTILQFNKNIKESADEFSPNIICNFLFDLSQKYNLFYNRHAILKAEKKERELRLTLTFAVSQVLKNGLSLLGIEVPNQM